MAEKPVVKRSPDYPTIHINTNRGCTTHWNDIHELIKEQSETTWSYSYTRIDNYGVLRRVVKKD